MYRLPETQILAPPRVGFSWPIINQDFPSLSISNKTKQKQKKKKQEKLGKKDIVIQWQLPTSLLRFRRCRLNKATIKHLAGDEQIQQGWRNQVNQKNIYKFGSKVTKLNKYIDIFPVSHMLSECWKRVRPKILMPPSLK